MTRTILVVEDQKNVQRLITDFLSGQGYDVVNAYDGRKALEITEQKQPDLILLDIMMPRMDGYQFIKQLRRESNIPVIMITAKRSESDVVRGFELGADDYITKPFRMQVLLMRVRAVLRRATPQDAAENQLQVGDVSLDKRSREVRKHGELVDLTPMEFNLLELLMDSAEHTVTKAALCIYLSERGYTGSQATLKIHVRNLRTKIEPDPSEPLYIETVFGIGYRLHAVES